MSKRSLEQPEGATKLRAVAEHVGPANDATNVIYIISIFCLRCSHTTEVVLHSSELPEWARDLLLSIRWDQSSYPFTELGRPDNWDKDVEDNKRKLQLQALCEPKSWVDHTGAKQANDCVRTQVLDGLAPEARRGYLHKLHMRAAQESLGETIGKYGQLLTATPKFVRANTVLSRGRVSIMEDWRDEQ
jgi:hypothetical protein